MKADGAIVHIRTSTDTGYQRMRENFDLSGNQYHEVEIRYTPG